jgi:hypothetical protein
MPDSNVIKKKKASSGPSKRSAMLDIHPEFISEIKDRLIEGKRIRRKLPNDGWLNIDRNLPFLIVYRRSARLKDEWSHKLVKGEASYMVAPGTRAQHSGLSHLILTIAETQAQLFGSFLIIELWTSAIRQNSFIDPNLNRPEFQIITSPTRPPTHTVEALEEALKRIKVNRMSSKVEIIYHKNRNPSRFAPLIPSIEARKLNGFVVGLQVGAMYRREDTGEIFPLAFRKLHLGLSSALKIAAFTFARRQTSMRPKHLGD